MKEWHGIPLVFDGTATVDGYIWSYRVKNGAATIVAEKDGRFSCAVSPAPSGDVSIPATLNGVKVTSIGREAFKNCSELKSVTIPVGVTGIEWEAFRFCKGLASVTIPEGVTHIDVNAFCDCGGLKSVTLPSSLKNIGWGAFGRCVGLTSVTIPNSVETIWHDAFNGCSGLKSVVIPDNVTSIGDRAFLGCSELESVAIPAGVARIGNGVFGDCNALKVIQLDSGNPAFTLIDGVLYTKDRSELVMYPNPSATVVIPEGVTSIRGWAFTGGSGMTSVTIPESVTNIKDHAFLRCDGLKSITIPSSVKNIGVRAFEQCAELTEVKMLGERPEAPENLFFPGCGKLKAIHVPANAKSWAGMKDWCGIPLVFDGESVNERVDAPTREMSVVANKLQGCNFLLNKDFKKNAKYYLCLFSASWCGPCRREMPRIAKTYAETLKDDPNIELIHFSWDQNDEKALAWAKEYDVKFPVVKPKGGNPLDLHTRGIPHLFIVKADGTLMEEGHPMKLFTDEKLRELKAANDSMAKATEKTGDVATKLFPGSMGTGLEKSLVGYWPFDGNANDATRYHNNGTLHDVTPAEDRHGNANKAYRFNGSSYIEVPHSETLVSRV
jgi:thiol-disulfide isomerase/thioredoxin